MSTENLTVETMQEVIAASERIIFSSPHGLSGRSISSTTVKPGISLSTLAELGAIWGDYTLASGDHLISVSWEHDINGSEDSFIGILNTGHQHFTFNLIMPVMESHIPIQVSELREVIVEADKSA